MVTLKDQLDKTKLYVDYLTKEINKAMDHCDINLAIQLKVELTQQQLEVKLLNDVIKEEK